jgi:hypothetical protein
MESVACSPWRPNLDRICLLAFLNHRRVYGRGPALFSLYRLLVCKFIRRPSNAEMYIGSVNVNLVWKTKTFHLPLLTIYPHSNYFHTCYLPDPLVHLILSSLFIASRRLCIRNPQLPRKEHLLEAESLCPTLQYLLRDPPGYQTEVSSISI